MPHVTLLSDPPERVRVGKVLAVARNYHAHAAEMGSTAPPEPVFFLKPATAIVEEGGAILLPEGVGEVHHEVELAVLVGGTLRDAMPKIAMEAVVGLAVCVDVTARDLQRRAKEEGEPWTASKGYDTFFPVSAFLPPARFGDPQDATLRLAVNGKVRQEGSTRLMVHDVGTLLAAASRVMTLERGDVVATGTPQGIGALRPGDRVRAEIVDKVAVEFPVRSRPGAAPPHAPQM